MKRLGNPRSATLAALLLATSLWLGLASTTRAEAVDTSSHASAATQAWFLQLEAVKGESLDAAHKDWIEVLSFSWGLDRKATAAGRNGKGPGETAGGSAGGLLDGQDLTITKFVDLATPKLMELLAKGSHIKTAVLSLCERTSTTTIEYLRITMTDVLVPSMNTGGDCVSGRPIDTLTLTFAKISVQYTRQSSTGAGLSVNFNWDFGANRGF